MTSSPVLGITCHVTPDPQDPDTVYVNNLRFWKSIDGGKTYQMIATPHGDNHDLWIDPQNPQRMAQGNDGGACVSLKWRRIMVIHIQPANSAVLSRGGGQS